MSAAPAATPAVRERVVGYARGKWFVRNAPELGSARELVVLEERLRAEAAAARGEHDPPVRIRLLFDHRSLPGWLRPYAWHYFNRTLIVGPEAGEGEP